MRKKMSILLAVLMIIGLFAGAAAAKTFISIATGGTGGTYYPLGGGIAEIISRNLPEFQVTSETGNASAANLNLIGTHQIEMAFAQNDVAYWASKGMSPFKEKYDNIRVVASLYPEHVQCITIKGSGVEDIMDIKGKRVSVGAPGSGVLGDVTAILDVADQVCRYEHRLPRFQQHDPALQGRTARWAWLVAGYPTSSIMDLSTTHDISLVSFNDAFLDKLIDKYSFFIKDVIPAGTYKGVDKDVPTAAVMAMLVCDADLPEETVYQFTKALWDNIEELYKVHAKAKLITLKTGLNGASVPVHPGAAKYYKEQGMTVPVIK
ncbi:TAXI family TRAP transporter solute-binding subunit [Aminivibrio sp.]